MTCFSLGATESELGSAGSINGAPGRASQATAAPLSRDGAAWFVEKQTRIKVRIEVASRRTGSLGHVEEALHMIAWLQPVRR